MFDVSVKINDGENKSPNAAFREAEKCIRKAQQEGKPVSVGFVLPDGKSYNYDLSDPQQRAWAALWSDVLLGGALKDLEPEQYVARETIRTMMDATLPKRYSYNDPEGVPVDSLPGSPFYDAEEALREMTFKGLIADVAPRLKDAYAKTHGQSSVTIDRNELAQYEYCFGMVTLALKWSRMHPDELRWWLFASHDAPFAVCDEGLRVRIVEALMRL